MNNRSEGQFLAYFEKFNLNKAIKKVAKTAEE